MCIHGFRGMASTLLNEQGYRPDIIEAQLAHGERNAIRAAYNHAEYLPERRTMMQAWAEYLDELRSERARGVRGGSGGGRLTAKRTTTAPRRAKLLMPERRMPLPPTPGNRRRRKHKRLCPARFASEGLRSIGGHGYPSAKTPGRRTP